MGKQNNVRKKASSKSGHHFRGNVMTSVNWFGGVFETVLIPTGAVQHGNWFGIACLILAASMFLAYLGIYIYFAITNPDRLQTEEYNLYQQELTLDNGAITVKAQSHNITRAMPEGMNTKS